MGLIVEIDCNDDSNWYNDGCDGGGYDSRYNYNNEDDKYNLDWQYQSTTIMVIGDRN